MQSPDRAVLDDQTEAWGVSGEEEVRGKQGQITKGFVSYGMEFGFYVKYKGILWEDFKLCVEKKVWKDTCYVLIGGFPLRESVAG